VFLTAGVYVLEVLSSSVVFPTVKVQVKGDDRVRAISFDFPGAPHKAMKHPLRLQPLAEPVFFTPKPQPNLLGMLRNPQVLLMGGMLVMTMLMPSGPQCEAGPRAIPPHGTCSRLWRAAGQRATSAAGADARPFPSHVCHAAKEQKEDQKRQMKELGFNGNPGDIQSMMAGLMGKGGAAADSDDED